MGHCWLNGRTGTLSLCADTWVETHNQIVSESLLHVWAIPSQYYQLQCQAPELQGVQKSVM